MTDQFGAGILDGVGQATQYVVPSGAQGPINNLGDFAGRLVGILNMFVPLIIALALLYFLWGVTQYALHGGDEKKREEAVTVITYGLVALFVMVSVWGLVNVLSGTFPLNLAAPAPPRF